MVRRVGGVSACTVLMLMLRCDRRRAKEETRVRVRTTAVRVDCLLVLLVMRWADVRVLIELLLRVIRRARRAIRLRWRWRSADGSGVGAVLAADLAGKLRSKLSVVNNVLCDRRGQHSVSTGTS